MEKRLKIIIVTGVICILVLLAISHVLYVYIEPWHGGETTPTASMEVENLTEDGWKLTIDRVSPEIDLKKVVIYQILDEEENVIMTGKLGNDDNITFVDVDNSSTLSEGDIIYVTSSAQERSVFELIYKPTGGKICKTVLE